MTIFARKNQFSEEFLQYLADFKFECDVYAVEEGTPVFPNEPLVTVKGPAIQAQLLETMLLLTINHQSLIATKANRIVRAAQGRPVLSSVQDVRKAAMPRYSAQEPHLSEVVREPPALAVSNFTAFLRLAPWRTRGYRCMTPNLKRLKRMRDTIPTTAFLLVDTYNVVKSGNPECDKGIRKMFLNRSVRDLKVSE